MSRVQRSFHDTKNMSLFSRGARAQEAVEKSNKQSFQYINSAGAKVNNGPVLDFGLFETLPNGKKKHIDVPGVEFEWGDRIYQTNEHGTVRVIEDDWLDDREAETSDQREYETYWLRRVMRIEDDRHLETIFGGYVWQQIKRGNAHPSYLNALPRDSPAFFTGVNLLKQKIRESKLASRVTNPNASIFQSKANLPSGVTQAQAGGMKVPTGDGTE
jgi:hypothetical protein